MSKLKYYYDMLSQPSRALWIALQMSKTPYEDCKVALKKREQLTDEFKQINRFQKVPCIVHGDFKLAESVAIVRYLADKDLLSAVLYPKALEQRARVDEYLEWQHLTVRLSCGSYFRNGYLLPAYGLVPKLSAEQESGMIKNVEANLELIERIWLEKSKFLTGQQLTAADIFGACEIEQLKFCKYNVRGKKFPKTADWLARVRDASNPYFDEAHVIVNKKVTADAAAKKAKN